MFKKIFLSLTLITVLGLLVLGAAQSTQAKTASENELPIPVASGPGGNPNSISKGPARGTSAPGLGNGAGANTAEALPNLPPATPGTLSAAETASLLYMREEEKLAHDVYVTLYAQWGLPLFQNISQSEQAHTDAVKVLLDRYGVEDPASNQVGVFTNPELQALYNDLVARGSQSVADALKVGAAIEEIDILDLEASLAETETADIQQVYTQLLSGSYNHLRAFANSLANQTGETYQPQFISPEAYQSIISAASQIGGNGRGGTGTSARGNGSGANGNGQGGQPGGRP